MISEGAMANYIIKYRGILSEMYVTGFSDPIDFAEAETERSVKASSRIADAQSFAEDEIEEALALTRRCHPSAEKLAVRVESSV